VAPREIPLVKLDRDALTNADTKQVAQGIVHLADAAQKLDKHTRVLATAGFLALLLERLDIPPQDPMTILGNLRAEAERQGRVEFRAIEQYLRDDLTTR
jgi:hypothetical protein